MVPSLLEELNTLLSGSPHLLERASVESAGEFTLAHQQVNVVDVVLVSVVDWSLLALRYVVLAVGVVILQQN